MKKHLLRGMTALAALGLAGLAHAGPYSGLYLFGDSLSDVGNDYQITGGAVPTSAYYTDGSHVGRFTNGLTYADRLAAGLGLGLTASLQGGTDYAYGGARTTYVSPGLVPFGALSFVQQVAAYDAGHAQANASGLYVLWIGANDMSDAIPLGYAGNPTAVSSAITTATQGIGNAIQDLASRGATHFLIPNLPDLSLTPQVRGYGLPDLSAFAQSASQQFNVALEATLGQFTGLDIRQLDIYGLQTAITDNPGTYGFDNTTSSCYTGDVNGLPLPGGPAPSVCATPSTYMYWDYEHPTDALHAELGSAALAAVVPEPATWTLLMMGLSGFGWVRARRRPQGRPRL
jgi:phospholipase/lecithinase/hemolysin